MSAKTLFVVQVSLLVFACHAAGQVVSVKLTANALGFGAADQNGGSVVQADLPGRLITSPVAGEGSILTVQQSGIAGPGTLLDPLLVTITSKTHLDTVSGLPPVHDYLAGVIFLSDESNALPDGADEGLGIKAFKVVGATGLRELDGGTGRARIEGSKHVSGGTGPTAYVAGNPNGAPHVDESAHFEFNPLLAVKAAQTEALLSVFESTDVIDLRVELWSGAIIELNFLKGGQTPILEAVDVGAKLWKVKLGQVPGVQATDILKSFSIRANDDNPQNPAGTAEHFFITGITSELIPCTTVALSQDLGPACNLQLDPVLSANAPVLGSNWTMCLDSDPVFAGALGFWFASIPPATPYTVPGIGCTIYVDIFNPANFFLITEFLLDNNGDWCVTVPLPQLPALAGIELIIQMRICSPTGPAGPLAPDWISNGIHVRIGC